MSNVGGVLVVDDDAIIRLELVSIVDSAGFIVAGEAGTTAEALRLATESRPSIALLDINLDGQGEGLDIAHRLREFFATRIIFVTGLGEDLPDEVLTFRPDAIIQKPFTTDQVITAIQSVGGGAPDPAPS